MGDNTVLMDKRGGEQMTGTDIDTHTFQQTQKKLFKIYAVTMRTRVQICVYSTVTATVAGETKLKPVLMEIEI